MLEELKVVMAWLEASEARVSSIDLIIEADGTRRVNIMVSE